MEAVLKKMKALKVEKDNVFSQVNSNYDQNSGYGREIRDTNCLIRIQEINAAAAGQLNIFSIHSMNKYMQMTQNIAGRFVGKRCD